MGNWAQINMTFDDQIKRLKIKQKKIETQRGLTDEQKLSNIDLINVQIKNLKD